MFLLYLIVKCTKILVQGGVVHSLIKDSTPVNTMLTGPFLPLAFCLTWQAVPGPVILCNLLSVGQFQFMTLQPINFTSIIRGWHEFTSRCAANRGLAASPSLATQPMQIQLKHATAAYNQKLGSCRGSTHRMFFCFL